MTACLRNYGKVLLIELCLFEIRYVYLSRQNIVNCRLLSASTSFQTRRRPSSQQTTLVKAVSWNYIYIYILIIIITIIIIYIYICISNNNNNYYYNKNAKTDMSIQWHRRKEYIYIYIPSLLLKTLKKCGQTFSTRKYINMKWYW